MKVRAGSKYSHRGGCRARIQEVLKHPHWSVRRAPDNDVALGLLDRELELKSKVSWVQLPNVAAVKPPIDDVDVMSWGAKDDDGLYRAYREHKLQTYCSHLYSRRTCNAVLSNYGAEITANFFCVSQRGSKGPCTRDTGAPAISGGVLWGLASWGIRKSCGKERYPAVFSYVGSQSNLFFITNGTKYFTDKLKSKSNEQNSRTDPEDELRPKLPPELMPDLVPGWMRDLPQDVIQTLQRHVLGSQENEEGVTIYDEKLDGVISVGNKTFSPTSLSRLVPNSLIVTSVEPKNKKTKY